MRFFCLRKAGKAFFKRYISELFIIEIGKIVICHVIRYNIVMIKSFKNSTAEEVFADGECKSIPYGVIKRARRKLFSIDAAARVEDLRMPPGNRLHLLLGDREGQYSLSVNEKWRICFRFEDGNAYDVELCDYH